MMFRLACVMLIALAACAQLPPSPQEIEAKRFARAPGEAVIYLVRDVPDLTDIGAAVMLDDRLMGSTYPGTFFRWVVPPGRHEIRGYAGDGGYYALDVNREGARRRHVHGDADGVADAGVHYHVLGAHVNRPVPLAHAVEVNGCIGAEAIEQFLAIVGAAVGTGATKLHRRPEREQWP